MATIHDLSNSDLSRLQWKIRAEIAARIGLENMAFLNTYQVYHNGYSQQFTVQRKLTNGEWKPVITFDDLQEAFDTAKSLENSDSKQEDD